MTTQVRKKRRGPSQVRVSGNTEWTDSHGLLELFGIRRSTGYHLAEEGVIKSVSLKQPGEKRGVRLFHVPTIRSFLNSQLQGNGAENE
jgi:hypothetical protein